tara:strand:+ start:461 stop:1636 length:1176 start_codon:yes stop_codon:yes gene_type:complete
MSNPNGGLITETNAQYYAGQQAFVGDNATLDFTCTFNTDLIATVGGVSNTNYSVTVNGAAQVENTNYSLLSTPKNTIRFTVAPALDASIVVSLVVTTKRDNYGGYQYASLNDIINNFIVAYVGAGKLIPSVKRTDVIFHAKRGMQEFSYDTLKSVKSQELTISPSLTAVIPQDYVNYVRLSWIDQLGVKRIIYPNTNLTINPAQAPEQDSTGQIVQDNLEENIDTDPPQTVERWRSADDKKITGLFNADSVNAGYDIDGINMSSIYWGGAYGQRYGLDPSLTQTNGWFGIDEARGVFTFSSNLKGRLIVIEYISDGLAYDLDTRVPKMIEDAMYAHISHAIIASRINQPEYIVNRLKRERSAKLRNAKIRLSNIKIGELTQLMRGKSKWIK